MRNSFGKQGRENGGVSNLSIVVILPPVAAGVPAFLRGMQGRSYYNPPIKKIKAHERPSCEETPLTVTFKCRICKYEACGEPKFVAHSADAHIDSHDQQEGA